MRRGTPLADLLTAAGTAFATANTRLAEAGAPVLLRDASLTLVFHSTAVAAPEGLVLARVAHPSLQQLALAGRGTPAANTTLTISLSAAPAVRGPGP